MSVIKTGTSITELIIEHEIKTFLSGSLTIDLRRSLEQIREKSLAARARPDLLWHRLCAVVATSGSSRNADAFMDLYETELRFDRLPKKTAARERQIADVLAQAKVPRMRQMKAEQLSNNYVRVSKLGGPEAATKVMLSLSGRAAKQEWIRQFEGVGEKYSNDIWMDICDPDFQDAIALDTRVKNFAALLGLEQKSRSLAPDLLAFAKDCGLSGWELDRLIYNFGDIIEAAAKNRLVIAQAALTA